MARLRTLKPGFFRNEHLCKHEPLTRILFEGLWCLADREGRLEDRPERIAIDVLPYDRHVDVDAMLDTLAAGAEPFIVRYAVDGKRYIQVVNFTKHQTPHVKEAPSTIPPPPGHGPAPDAPVTPVASPVQTPDEHSADTGLAPMGTGEWEPVLGSGDLEPQDAAPEVVETLPPERAADSPKSLRVVKPKRLANEYTADFERFWSTYPGRRLDKWVAFREWQRRLKGGATVEGLTRAAEHFAADCERRGTEDEFIPHARTWLHQRRDEAFQRGAPNGKPVLSKGMRDLLMARQMRDET